MNFKAIIAASACTLTLMACGGPGEGKSISEIKNPTEIDSLFYYFGQLRANEYWQQTRMDSTLNTQEARQQYLKGMEEGLKLGKEGNEAYNQGLFNGLTIAMNCIEFEKEYNLKPNKDIIMQSVAYGLRNDSAVDANEAQSNFYEIIGRIADQKLARDKKEAAESLKKEAAKLKMSAVNEDLYCKVTTPGSGAQLKIGDKITLQLDIKKADGSDLGLPMPNEIEIGAGLPETLTKALTSMKPGEKATFASTAIAIFGERCSQMGMKPADVLIINIEIKGLGEAAPAAAADSTKSAKPAAVSVKPAK